MEFTRLRKKLEKKINSKNDWRDFKGILLIKMVLNRFSKKKNDVI